MDLESAGRTRDALTLTLGLPSSTPELPKSTEQLWCWVREAKSTHVSATHRKREMGLGSRR